MAWEKRKSGFFFYKNTRLPGGRKVKTYYGRGRKAYAEATLLKLRKAATRIQSEIIRELISRTLEAENLLKEFHTYVSELLAAEMLASGFHNPGKRGWRRIMRTDIAVENLECSEHSVAAAGDHSVESGPPGEGSSSPRTDVVSNAEIEPTGQLNQATIGTGSTRGRPRTINMQGAPGFATSAESSPGSDAESVEDADGLGEPLPPAKSIEEMSVQELRHAASAGNRAAISRLRPMMNENASHYAALGNLEAKVLLRWLDAICGDDLFHRECVRRSMLDLRTELGKEGDSPLEKLLTDEVVLSFLRHKYWTGREAQSLRSDFGPAVAEFAIEQSSKSQKMFLRASNALRDYRHLVVRRSVVHLTPVMEQ